MPSLEASIMNDRESITRYLLGQMSEADRLLFQERMFNDDEFFDAVTEVETDLIDAYARGELTPAEREQMEHSLLGSSAAQKRVAFAAALAGISTAAGPLATERPSRPSLRWLPVAAAVLLAVAAGVLLIQNRALQNTISALRQQQTSNPADLRPLHEADAPPVFAILLSPGVIRGSQGMRQISVPAASRLVELQLDLRGERREPYTATLSTTGGKMVWRLGELSARREAAGTLLSFWVPASLLGPAQYELAVTAGTAEPPEFYYFRVVPH